MVDFSIIREFGPLENLLVAIYYQYLVCVYIQSRKSAVDGAVKVAKKQGMIAAYLNVIAIVAALVVACLVMGLVLGLYGPVYT